MKSCVTPAAPKDCTALSTTHDGELGGDDLDRGDLDPRALVADGVHQPRRLEHEQAGLLDAHPRVGDPLADDALLDQRAAERVALAACARPSSPARARRRRSPASRGGSGPGRAGPGRSRSRRPPRRAGSSPGRGRCRRRCRRGRRAGRRGSRARASSGGCRRPARRAGTRIMLWRRWRSASGSVTPMTISRSQRDDIAPEVNHLRPLMTYSSPSRVMRVAMFVASDEATSGSVIENADRVRPSSSGSSQRVLLLLGAEARQQLHVAGVGRRAVEDLGREERAAAHDLAQRRVLHVRQAGAALVVGEEEVPQALVARARP